MAKLKKQQSQVTQDYLLQDKILLLQD